MQKKQRIAISTMLFLIICLIIYFTWYFWNTICVILTTMRWPDVIMTYRQKSVLTSFSSFLFRLPRLCSFILDTWSCVLRIFSIRCYFNSLPADDRDSNIWVCIMCCRGPIFLKHLSLPKIWVIVNNFGDGGCYPRFWARKWRDTFLSEEIKILQ